MKLEDLRVGMNVTYVPSHAEGSAAHPDCERGVVTSWTQYVEGSSVMNRAPVTVFVRYGSQPNSKATSLENLVSG